MPKRVFVSCALRAGSRGIARDARTASRRCESRGPLIRHSIVWRVCLDGGCLLRVESKVTEVPLIGPPPNGARWTAGRKHAWHSSRGPRWAPRRGDRGGSTTPSRTCTPASRSTFDLSVETKIHDTFARLFNVKDEIAIRDIFAILITSMLKWRSAISLQGLLFQH